MPSAEGLPVLVLAAGRGTRMGTPKALMQVAGDPWWTRQLESLTAAAVTPIWITSPEVRTAMQQDPRALKQPLIEANPEAPMFESIRAGLRFLDAAQPRGLYILPIDVPAAQPEVWAALADAAPVSAPTHAGAHGHPVYLDGRFARDHIANAPAGARLDTLITGHVRYIPVDDPSVTLNLNTPDALRDYEERLRVRGWG